MVFELLIWVSQLLKASNNGKSTWESSVSYDWYHEFPASPNYSKLSRLPLRTLRTLPKSKSIKQWCLLQFPFSQTCLSFISLILFNSASPFSHLTGRAFFLNSPHMTVSYKIIVCSNILCSYQLPPPPLISCRLSDTLWATCPCSSRACTEHSCSEG